nr:zf-HC2 domain-containing protein [Micromonospora sp. DSM 115978]
DNDFHPLDDLPSMVLGELPPDRDAEVATHLATCDACRRELAVVTQMSSWLRDAARLPVADQVELPPLRLSDADLTDDGSAGSAGRHALRGRHGQRRGRGRGSEGNGGRPRRLLVGAAAAVAAVVLAAGGLVTGLAVGSGDDDSAGGGPATAVVLLTPLTSEPDPASG